MANSTITAGGTAQALHAARYGRQGWSVQNLSSGDLWVSDAGTASATNGIKVIPGALYETPPDYESAEAVSIFGATTGQTFALKEW